MQEMATKRRLVAISPEVQGTTNEGQARAEGRGSAKWIVTHLLRTWLLGVEDFCLLEFGEGSKLGWSVVPEGVLEVDADDRVDAELFAGLDRFFGR